MELTLLHLYPELMSLYGDYANLAVLRRHLERLGVNVTVKTASLEETPDLTADLLYMGAGTERAQKAVLQDMPRYAAALRQTLSKGAVLLFTGNAMETLGASVTDAAGTVWPALGLADFTTQESKTRTPQDVLGRTSLWEGPVVGFMNKCSVTRGIDTPLLESLSLGFGNESQGGAEGYVDGNVFATHLSGPVLTKNPAFTRLIIQRLFARRGWTLPETIREDPLEQRAYAAACAELSKRVGEKK